ncbi:MAG: alpha/beta hydrolase [Chloroflexi bacterium]|nr:alpha/beta hydrolase [Chloroflexota bacterium]
MMQRPFVRRIVALLLIIGGAAAALHLLLLDWQRRLLARLDAQSFVIETARGPVEYSDVGVGPVVLHLHGGVVAHDGWFYLDYLVEAGYRVITPSRPGYLRTPLADHGSPQFQADVMASFIDALKLEKVIVVGMSAGGLAALQFALRYPDRTESLVLKSAITRQTGLSEAQQTSALGRIVLAPWAQTYVYALLYWAGRLFPRQVLNQFYLTETTLDPAQRDTLVSQVLGSAQQRKSYAALLNAMVPIAARLRGLETDMHNQYTSPDYELDAITAPTLIIHSRHDGDSPFANAEFAAELIPNAEFVPVDQFGHLINWGDEAGVSAWQTRAIAFMRQHNTA